jgi:hypothetical protein
VTQTVQYDCVVDYDFHMGLGSLGISIMPDQQAVGTVTDTSVYTDFVY